MPRLHSPDEIFSSRYTPSWFLLCFAAGVVNGVALLACQRFVTHVTGTVTRLGLELLHVNILLDFVAVLLCFVAGATLSGLLINGRAQRGQRPFFSVPLWICAAVIASAGLAGQFGWLGPFGGTVDEPGDFVFLCALSFAMGLQNAAVATSTGALVRTTHLTGPATDLGVHLAELIFARGRQQALAGQHALLRFGKIVAYATGAVIAVPLARVFGFSSLLLPAAVISVVSVISFVRKEAEVQRPSVKVEPSAPSVPATFQ